METSKEHRGYVKSDIVLALQKSRSEKPTEQSASLTGKAKTDVPVGTSKLAPVSSADRLSASLRYYLKKRGMTQAQLGERIGVGQSRIADILGQKSLISIGILDRLSKALHVSSYRLLMPIREK